MSKDMSAERLLANYLQGFLFADDEWLEVDGTTATYWQARLAQTTTIENLPDGRTKWRVRTRIVNDVTAGSDVHELCLALNRFAAGWSFAYDPEARTVDAVVAICAPVDWDTFFLRLSEKAKLSAWMSDVLAERLAEAVGGVPAFSHPRAQSAVRESFDGTYYLLQTLRARPEWILDLTHFRFPRVEETAATIAEMVGAPEEAVWSDDTELRIMLGASMGLSAGFDRHPVVGDCWQSSLVVPPRQSSTALAEHLGAMTWALFDGPDTNLLGAWTIEDDALKFRQWNTMSEVRYQEHLGSFTGHSVADLWGFTSTLSDVLGMLSESELPADDDSQSGGEVAELAAHIAAAIAEQARPAVSERPVLDEEPADRRLLWLYRRQILVVAAWFNPMGPTVTSTEVCALPDGTEYLVHFRRHPLSPYYRVIGPLTDGDDAELMDEATELLLGGGLPNVLTLWYAPGATAADVPDYLREAILAAKGDADPGLAGDAAWIEHTLGSPWEFAAFDQTEAHQFKVEAQREFDAHPSADRGFAMWWQQASRYENVLSNFRFLPDAWDGTLNTQQAFNNLRLFDTDPLIVTYSKIGMPGPDHKPSES